MRAIFLITAVVLIGVPFLIQSANALLIDIKPLCLSEAIRDNGTNITAVAHMFDQCIQKMQMLDSNIHAAGDVGNSSGGAPAAVN